MNIKEIYENWKRSGREWQPGRINMERPDRSFIDRTRDLTAEEIEGHKNREREDMEKELEIEIIGGD